MFTKKILILSLLLFSCLSKINSQFIGEIEDVATSQALPAGMKLVWADEFNGAQLDTTKWFTDYYSTIDFVNKTNYEKMCARQLPQPGISFTGNSIVLFVDDETPNSGLTPLVPMRDISSKKAITHTA